MLISAFSFHMSDKNRFTYIRFVLDICHEIEDWTTYNSFTITFKGVDFSAILFMGNNFCNFPFAFLHSKTLLKRGLSYKTLLKRISEQGSII